MSAADVDRRIVTVEAGLQWAWAAAQQVRRLRLQQHRVLTVEDLDEEPEDQRHRYLELRADGELCLIAASNLVRVIDSLDPPSSSTDDLGRAVARLRSAFAAGRSRRRLGAARPRDAEVIDLRDDPQRCSLGADGVRIGGLALDELGDVLETVLVWFAELERSSFLWDGWSAVGR